MRKSFLYVLALALVTFASACKPKAETAVAPAPAPANEMAPAPAAPAPAEPAAAPAVVGEIGVPECDDYLNKWQACIDTKVTAEAREQVKVALDATREGWKRTAAIPEGKAGLAAACREAGELASTQVSAYGCTW